MSSSRARRFGLGGGALAVIAVIVGVMALTASAKSSSTIGMSKSAKVGSVTEPIAVNSKGVAVYELSPETTRHLLCTSANGCLKVWMPVTVAHGAKATKASAVKGTLGSFVRNGVTQVTLSGHPLYTFVQDHGQKGVAHGNDLKSFGGTWHVFSEGKASVSKTTSTTSSPSGGGSGY